MNGSDTTDSVTIEDLDSLPSTVRAQLTADGIESLYPPQASAIESGILDGANVVASVPTASGKTLIAELAMLSSIARGGMALYIVPLRALASEKRTQFQRWESADVSIGVSTGNYESDGEWLASRDIIVATSEKVDSLIRNGAEWITDLTCVVADEVHLVDDGSRGPTLEVTIAKLRQLNPSIQVVALSATIGNAAEIADWLDAGLIESEWRPIELRMGVHYRKALHFDDGGQEKLAVGNNEKVTTTLVTDALESGGSSLVFVNSRRNAESAARRLALAVEKYLSTDDREILAALGDEIRGVSDTETSEDLATVVEKGAAFHHAGLHARHRAIVEDAFRDRAIKTISATPTLAAGVNTPSRRVIVRDWRRYSGSVGGMQPLATLEVHQMCGRAGRPGLDPYGDALLIAKSHEELDELFERYIWADPEPVRSKLAAEPALRTHLLATVATGFASSREGILHFLDRTLYSTQATDSVRLASVTDRTLEYLNRNGFVETTGPNVSATSIGHTVSRLYLDPMSAAEIIHGLRSADREPSAFGLYQLVSRTPDMWGLYLRSGDHSVYTEIAYDREEEFLGEMPSEFETEHFEDWLSATKTGKLLEDWANEVDEGRITERYRVGPGDIRGKVETAEWLLNAAERLGSELGIEGISAIRTAKKRIEHGIKGELIELTTVRGVGRKRARRLYNAGIHSREELRTADKRIVLSALQGRRKTAETILRNAGHSDPTFDDVTGSPAETNEREQQTPARESGQSGLGDF